MAIVVATLLAALVATSMRRVAVFVLIVAAGLGLGSTPAYAHAELLSTEPASAAVLDQPPGQIVLRFDEAVDTVADGVRLFNGAGDPIDVGKPQHLDGDAKVVVAAVPELADGSYVVDWRVASADSHAIHAAFTFQVGATSTLDPGVVDRIGQGVRLDRSAAIALGVSRSLVIAAIAIVIGGLTALGAGVVAAASPIRRMIPVAGMIGAVAGLIALPIQTAYVSGRTLRGALSTGAWTTALDTRVGRAWLARAVIMLVVGVVLSRMSGRPNRSAWWAWLGLATVSIGLASAYGGHGASGRWPIVGVVTTVVHVAAMAIWLGGLLAALVGLGSATADQIMRFSRLAMVAVVVIVATGSVQAIRQIPHLSSITHTDFGVALIWKLAAVSAVLLTAVFSRQLVHGESLGFALLARRLPPPEVPDHPIDVRTLRKSMGVETFIAVGVIALTSMLMAANPSASRPQPFSANVIDRDVSASIFITPGVVGSNEVHLALSSLSGALKQADAVTLTIADPSRDVAAIIVALVDAGGTHLIAPRAEIPYAGTWQFTVTARYGFDKYTFVTTAPIG